MSARKSATGLVQLRVSIDTLEPSVRSYLDELDRRSPEPLRPGDGQHGIAERIVELDGARFVPLILTVPGLGLITAVVGMDNAAAAGEPRATEPISLPMRDRNSTSNGSRGIAQLDPSSIRDGHSGQPWVQ